MTNSSEFSDIFFEESLLRQIARRHVQAHKTSDTRPSFWACTFSLGRKVKTNISAKFSSNR